MKTTKPIHYISLVCTLIISVFWAISVGRFELPIEKVLAALNMPFTSGIDLNAMEQSIVSNIRLPRVITAAFVGAMLVISGATLQGVFRNLLVGPQMPGVSSGAAFGGALAILIESSVLMMMFISFISFIFGVLALLLTLVIERLSKTRAA